jgi:hypothetical protein
VVAWPLATRAQQPAERVRRVAMIFLISGHSHRTCWHCGMASKALAGPRSATIVWRLGRIDDGGQS